jgi:hypothetical protein
MSLPTTNIISSGGSGGRNGGAGTIYLKTSARANGDVILNNGGLGSANSTPLPALNLENIDVRGGANLALSGNLTTETSMFIKDSQITIQGGVTIPTDLTMDNSSLTVSGDVHVAGTLWLNNKSQLSHSAATTAVTYKLDIQAGSLNIDSTSKIDVSGRGYLGGNNSNGYTYGNVFGSTYQSGGSYGGLGGVYGGSTNGVYGNQLNPNEVGSGGGSSGTSYPGGNGGGLVRITAGTLSLDGTILADGGGSYYDPYYGYGGGSGGSGGGIRIDATTLSGGGYIYARGGSAGSPRGGGGGGRIALYYGDMSLPTTNIIASGGSGGRNGGAGTIHYSLFP